MKFLKVAYEDLIGIFKNRFIRISLIAIIIVPLLYSLLYLYAFWDPYSKLSKFPIAVVNLDNGYEKDGEAVSYGNTLVNKLKNNKRVGWKFVSKSEADSGLNGKKYFAELIIPKDFTSKLLSVNSDEMIKPDIIFATNDKKNFLASQINNSIMVELKDEIEGNMSKQYITTAFNDVNKFKDGLDEASAGSQKLYEGTNSVYSGETELNNGIQNINENAKALKRGVDDLNEGASKLNNGLSEASSGSESISEGSKRLSHGADDLYSGIVQLNNNINTDSQDIYGNPIGLVQGVNKLADGVNALNYSVNEGPNNLSEGVSELYNSVAVGSNSLSSGVNKLYEGLTHKDINPLNNGLAPSLILLNNLINQYEKAPAIEKPFLMGEIKIILKEAVKTTSTHSKDSSNPTFLDGITMLNKSINESSVDENGNTKPSLVEAVTSLNQGINKGKKDLSGKDILSLSDAVRNINDSISGNKGLKQGVTLLGAQVSERLLPGAEGLSNASKTLSTGVENLFYGLVDASKGSDKLSNGLNELDINMTKFAQGTDMLSQGSAKLLNGMTNIFNGIQNLNSNLAMASDKIRKNVIKGSGNLAEFISSPINIKKNSINKVNNYGTGFTPYFIPLSLWVGAIMMFFIITDKVDDNIDANSASIVIGKFLSYAFIGVLQAISVSIIVLVLGLRPNNIIMYFAFNIFMSFVFISIIQSLIFLLGSAGRLLSIVLLILQLTSCGGTFPMELVPKFFRIINPILPFTYCTSALREIISGSDFYIIGKDIRVLIVMFIVFLITSVAMKDRADGMQHILEK